VICELQKKINRIFILLEEKMSKRMNVIIELCDDPSRIAHLNKEVQNLHERIYPEYFKPYSFDEVVNFVRRMFREKSWKAIVAIENGVDVGYAFFYQRNYAENQFRKSYVGIHVDQVSVNPGMKKKGIGKAMMEWIEEKAAPPPNGSGQKSALHLR
jgi:GNAT superfamily N-acetyltransferase